MYWCLKSFNGCMIKQHKWKCSICDDILKSKNQPYCKSCSHIENQNIKMDLYNNQLISKNK